MPKLVNTGVWAHRRLSRYLQSDELGFQHVHRGTHTPPHTNAHNAFYINVKKIIGGGYACL